MRYSIKGRLWWVVGAAVFLAGPLFFIGFPKDATVAEKWMVSLASVLCVGLIFWKYAMIAGIRVEENGFVVERRLVTDLEYPWRGTVVSYHKGQRRAVEGLMIESIGVHGLDREPFFFPLRDVENEEQLLAEMREKLGVRFHEGEEQ